MNTIINNSPNEYASVNENRGLNITDAFKKINLSTEATILEFGCNVGRNLNFLYKNGFKNLTGVEICNAAIELGKKIYEQFMSTLKIKIESLRIGDPSDFNTDVGVMTTEKQVRPTDWKNTGCNC